MRLNLFLPLFLTTASLLNGVALVDSGSALSDAIINANGGGDPNIQFTQSFTYNQLLQPFNTDRVLNSVDRTFVIDGRGYTLTANAGSNRCFFARTNTGTVTIKDLTISGAIAKGGDGTHGGGGGLGAGGGLFLNKNSSVILDNVSFENCLAIGGSSSYGINSGGGGGGGLGGSGGQATNYGGGGGGGFSGNGGGSNGSTGGTADGGGGGGGGFNGNGGNANQAGGGGGGGGGFNGGDTNRGPGGGGAGDGGNGGAVTPGSPGGNGGNGSLGGIGGSGANSVGSLSGGGGSGAVGASPAGDGASAVGSLGGSLPGGGGGSGSFADPDLPNPGGAGGTGFGGGGSGHASSSVNPSGDGGSGGFGGGGGGSGGNIGNGGKGGGGKGGFGGGGGGGGSRPVQQAQTSIGGNGGEGGFGSGGGSAGYDEQSGTGGKGGFGGGGGSGTPPGEGGFGGGNGLAGINTAGIGGGGGAMGADIFIENGAALTIRTEISFDGSKLTAGTGGNNGQALGTNIFMMSSGSITVEGLTTDSTVPNPIESDRGAGGGSTSTGGLTLDALNSATFSINGENTYTGQTTINTGSLALNGSVITPVILNNGLFTGNATLKTDISMMTTSGNLTINNGTVAPDGFNFGTITVQRDLAFNGGTFLTEIDSLGNADFLDVRGSATIAPAAAITVENAVGNFLKGQTIVVLEADGGVAGTFGTENLPLSFNQPRLSIQYTGNTVELVVLRDHVFVQPIIDPGNPRQVAKYILDQLPIDPQSDFGLVVRSLGVLTDKELNKTLNMMHQGVFGTYEWMNLSTNAQIMEMFNQPRFRLFAEQEPGSLSQLTASTKPFYPHTPVQRGCTRELSSPHHVYFQPFGTWNSQSQKGELRGAHYESAGFLTGYDYLFRNFYIGAALGYAYTNFRWDSSAGKGHIDQVYGGLHASYFNRYFSATLGSMLGGNFYDTNRNITSRAPGHRNGQLDRTAHSKNSGIQWTNHLGFVGDMAPLSIPLQIFANLDHFYLYTGNFNETGAGSINLRVRSKTSNALRSELGLSSSYTFHTNGGCCWTPYARIGWVNKTLLSSSTYLGGFRGQIGIFSASATSKGTNQWSPGIGIEFANTHGMSLLLNARGELNGKMKNYFSDIRISYAF